MRVAEVASKSRPGGPSGPRSRFSPRLARSASGCLRLGVAAAVLGMAVAGTPLHAQNWTMFRGDAQHTGAVQDPISLPLSLSWRQVTGRPIPGVNPTSPIFVRRGENVASGYFVARDLVAGVRSDTGEAHWYYPSSGALGAGGRQTTVRTTPVFANGTVYVGASDGHVYAINASTGNLVWDYPTGATPVTASPIVVGDQLFFGTGGGSIMGLNARTGKPLMTNAELFKASDAIVGSLTHGDGFLYFVSRDQSAYALDLSRALTPQEGRRPRRVIRWRYTLNSPPAYSSPVLRGDLLYLVDGDNITALTASRGRRRWTFPADNTISNTPAVTDQGVYFGTRQGTFYALTLDGDQRWKTELAGPAYSSPIVARINATGGPGVPRYAVFVGSNRGFIYAFDTGFGTDSTADDGRPLFIYRVRPADPAVNTVLNVVASPVIFENRLYVLADDGSLLAFSADAPDVTPPLIWGELPDRSVEISGRPPITYLVNVSDDGSGINPDSIVMRVDDQNVEYTYDEYRGLIFYKFEAAGAGSREPVQPLPSGRHRVHVEVSDWKGNKTVRDWTFMANTNITDVRPPAIAP